MSNPPPQTVCPKCGTINQTTPRFCISCGNPLAYLPPAQPMPPPIYGPPQAWYPPPQQYYAYTASYFEAQRREQIDRTNTGLLLIAIGFFISWVPFVGIIGGIIELVGALLVILGRKAFGSKHDRNVILSVIIWVVGIAAVIVTIFIVIFFAILNFSTTSTPPTGVSPFGDSFLFAELVGSAIIGISYVLLTYELQQHNGRILLWCGYAVNIATGIINLLILTNISSLGLGFVFLGSFLSLGPAIIFGVAYYLARERIVRGEIPALQQSPG